jgi:plastocyanin
MLSLIAITCLLPLLSSAETTHNVKVGDANNAMKFDPDKVKAEVGDTINFSFYPKNHSVAQSSYDKPCEPMSGGSDMKPIFSGFMAVGSGEEEASMMYSVKINNTDPIWLYCSQASHCQDGQVMVINQKYAQFSNARMSC